MCLYVDSNVAMANLFQQEAALENGVRYGQLKIFCEVLRSTLPGAGGLWLAVRISDFKRIALSEPTFMGIYDSTIYIDKDSAKAKKEYLERYNMRFDDDQKAALKNAAVVALAST